jgi:hypothetical protein
MSRQKNIILIAGLIFLLSIRANAQQVSLPDTLVRYNSGKALLKPTLNYAAGTSFMFMPHIGSVTGITLTPQVSVPLSSKLTVDGGIIAGHYYSAFTTPGNDGLAKGSFNGTFNTISLYGSATYYLNPRLTLYGSGIRQLAGNSPFNAIPKSSYSIGSAYNFGSFSIGVTVHMTNWNNTPGLIPFNSTRGLYSPFDPWQF